MIGLGTLERLLAAIAELRASFEQTTPDADCSCYLLALEDAETRIRAEFGAESELRAEPFQVTVGVAAEQIVSLDWPARVRAVALWVHDVGLDGLRVSFPSRDARGKLVPCNLPALWFNPQREGSAQFAHLVEQVVPEGEPLKVTLFNSSMIPLMVSGVLMYRVVGGTD